MSDIFKNDRENKIPGDWLFKVIPWFIGFVFILIVGWFIFMGVMAFRIAENPDAAARTIGHTIHELQKGIMLIRFEHANEDQR